MATIEIAGYRCECCSHEWAPRNLDRLPYVCPRCKRRDWQEGPAGKRRATVPAAPIANESAECDSPAAPPPPVEVVAAVAPVPPPPIPVAPAVDVRAEMAAAFARQRGAAEAAREASAATERRFTPEQVAETAVRPLEDLDGQPLVFMAETRGGTRKRLSSESRAAFGVQPNKAARLRKLAAAVGTQVPASPVSVESSSGQYGLYLETAA